MKHIKPYFNTKYAALILSFAGLFFFTGEVLAAQDVGNVAENITANFSSLAKLITAGAYIAGLGFSLGAIMKFKQHKDNPTQIPIGTPIALLFIAAALLFLPTVLGTAGQTMFAGDQKAGEVGGLDKLP